MNQKIWHVFVAILISMMSLSHIVGAQTMQQNTAALNARQQSMVKIAALTASGDLAQLKVALNTGLDAGMSINEINDELTQMYAYSGFPRSLNGINTFTAVLNERKAQGIVDTQGRAASPVNDTRDKYTRGKATLEVLINGTDPGKSGGIGAVNPQVETFLKEHLFADIFDSDLLTYAERELATIAALASLPGLEPMLQSHMNMGLNVGITQPQMLALIEVVGTSINPKQAQIATAIFNEVLASRRQQ
ncbi:carboxymuconolactone decarboxylase family protein [Neisseria sp. Ec49-e6-T10]|uniref:carboxymuconolactone decarboxylase family protein n=1 Tax=Neisseria sp. Ec49-e6-T10 TaxID=3140744 RepID=UPI003EB7F577